jgi:hypothetical protein
MSVLAIPAELQPAFLLTFLGLEIGLPDSFRTGANSTDECPTALLLNYAYQQRFLAPVAVPVPALAGTLQPAAASIGRIAQELVLSPQNHCVVVEVTAAVKEPIENLLAEAGVSYFIAPSAVQALDEIRTRVAKYSHIFLMGQNGERKRSAQESAVFVFLDSLVPDPNSLTQVLEDLGKGTGSFRQCLDLIQFVPTEKQPQP